MMKTYLAFALVLGAAGAVVLGGCPNKQPTTTPNNTGSGSAVDTQLPDTRNELERRRDEACKTLGPKMTSCAVEDAKRDLAAGKIKQEQFDKDTAPEVQRKNTDEFFKKCHTSQFSSRQVRVLEVCQQQETDCEPMLACLDNLNKQ